MSVLTSELGISQQFSWRLPHARLQTLIGGNLVSSHKLCRPYPIRQFPDLLQLCHHSKQQQLQHPHHTKNVTTRLIKKVNVAACRNIDLVILVVLSLILRKMFVWHWLLVATDYKWYKTPDGIIHMLIAFVSSVDEQLYTLGLQQWYFVYAEYAVTWSIFLESEMELSGL